jgi:hypothetical protein
MVAAMRKKKKMQTIVQPQKNPAAVALGRMGGKATATKGSDYYRKLAAKRKTFKGGRPRKSM